MKPNVAKREIKLLAPESEIDFDFLQGMANRMSVSYYKYGPAAEGYPHRVSALASLEERINAYVATLNKEYLIDVANFAMLEFMHPSLKGAHFSPTDSDGSPGRVDNLGQVTHSGNSAIRKAS